jgi:hypothetical protein
VLETGGQKPKTEMDVQGPLQAVVPHDDGGGGDDDNQGCINPAKQVTWPNKFCVVAPNICGSSVWKLLYVTHLVPRIFRWHLDLWKICAPVMVVVVVVVGVIVIIMRK